MCTLEGWTGIENHVVPIKRRRRIGRRQHRQPGFALRAAAAVVAGDPRPPRKVQRHLQARSRRGANLLGVSLAVYNN